MIGGPPCRSALRYVQPVAATLYRNGVIHSPTDPFAEAILVADGQVAWMGSDDTVHAVIDGADEVVDLGGALVTPAFVDAHAHVLETGFALAGLDLSPAADASRARPGRGGRTGLPQPRRLGLGARDDLVRRGHRPAGRRRLVRPGSGERTGEPACQGCGASGHPGTA